MAPYPTLSPQAPSTPVVPLSADQPSVSIPKDFFHKSPTLFWLLVGVFSFAMALGVAWVAVIWCRHPKRRSVLKAKAKKEGTQIEGRSWSWFRRRTTVVEEEDKPGQEEEPEKADFGPLSPGWTQPVRSSSLAQLSRYLDAVFVPPYEHGLPLSMIHEDSLEEAYSGLRTSGVYQTDKGATDDGSMPSIVVDAAISTASLSSLAYLSTTSSPLTAFIESLDAFPRVPTTFPNLPSAHHLQVPAARSRPSSLRSPSSTKKRPASNVRFSLPGSDAPIECAHGKENSVPPSGERHAGQKTTKGAYDKSSNLSRPPTDRRPLKTIASVTMGNAF